MENGGKHRGMAVNVSRWCVLPHQSWLDRVLNGISRLQLLSSDHVPMWQVHAYSTCVLVVIVIVYEARWCGQINVTLLPLFGLLNFSQFWRVDRFENPYLICVAPVTLQWSNISMFYWGEGKNNGKLQWCSIEASSHLTSMIGVIVTATYAKCIH